MMKMNKIAYNYNKLYCQFKVDVNHDFIVESNQAPIQSFNLIISFGFMFNGILHVNLSL